MPWSMKASSAIDAAGSRITVYLPGSMAFASREPTAFSTATRDRPPVSSRATAAAAQQPAGAEPREFVAVAHRPARAESVVGAHGDGEVRLGRGVVGEQPL